MESRKIFTLAEAKALLPRVRALTDQCHDTIESIRVKIEAERNDTRRAALEERADALLQEWGAAITALGAEPKGLWLVDFDSGDGFYFCWQHGEDEIEFIHGYDAGYAGRRRITWS